MKLVDPFDTHHLVAVERSGRAAAGLFLAQWARDRSVEVSRHNLVPMRPILLLLFLAHLMGVGLYAQDTSPWTADRLRADHMAHLQELGHAPEVDADGDIRFVYKGRTYFITIDPADPTCFRMVLANVWPVKTEEERLRASVAMDRCNAQANVTKAFLVRDNVWLAVETFLPQPADHRAVFQRCLSALGRGVSIFAKAVREP